VSGLLPAEASVAAIVSSIIPSIFPWIVASPIEYAAKMLVEADAGLLGNACGVGIQGVKKTLNLLPDLLADEGDRRTAWCNALPWLDRVLHFPLYPACPQRNLS
jgi:hypothetical protein